MGKSEIKDIPLACAFRSRRLPSHWYLARLYIFQGSALLRRPGRLNSASHLSNGSSTHSSGRSLHCPYSFFLQFASRVQSSSLHISNLPNLDDGTRQKTAPILSQIPEWAFCHPACHLGMQRGPPLDTNVRDHFIKILYFIMYTKRISTLRRIRGS